MTNTSVDALDRDDSRGLAQQLVDRLRGRILDGSLAPGDRLPTESALIESYAVSRSVVREALSRLQAAGLVETQQGRGSFVLALPAPAGEESHPAVRTATDVADVMSYRIAVETEGAGLAAARRTPAQLASMQRALDEFTAAASAPHRVVEADYAFHLAVMRGSGNAYLTEALERYGPRMILAHRSRLGSGNDVTDRSHFDLVLHEHRAILDAVQAGDEAGARAAVRTHLSASRRRLMH